MVHKIIMVAILTMLAGCAGQTVPQPLMENEQIISDAVIQIVYDIFDEEYDELFIRSLFGCDVVEVSYVPEYIWLGNLFTENTELLKLAPEGISCFMRVPEQAVEKWPDFNIPKYFVINIGKKEDETYYTHVYGFYAMWDSLEELFEHKGLQFIEEHMQTFELYLPPRQAA